jgi:hypothetical protein
MAILALPLALLIYAAVGILQFDDRVWADAISANTVEGFERYLQVVSKGKHAAEAKDRIESLRWEQATRQNTITSYRRYVSAHPEGKFAGQAETRAVALRGDASPYEAALRAATEASLEAFLKDYPGHVSEASAREALREIRQGRDIVDLLGEKKVEIAVHGEGVDKVSIRLHRLVPYPVTVRIPPGSLLVSSNPWTQNMVTTSEIKVRLTTAEWQLVSADAACVNRKKSVPGSSDLLTVERSPHDEELAKLIAHLAKSWVHPHTRQAAVWIVTDNANFEDLGTLVVGFGGIGGSRAITEYGAASAMKICHEAGIDIARKAIWRDRQRVLSGLPAGDLRTWLEQKG